MSWQNLYFVCHNVFGNKKNSLQYYISSSFSNVCPLPQTVIQVKVSKPSDSTFVVPYPLFTLVKSKATCL